MIRSRSGPNPVGRGGWHRSRNTAIGSSFNPLSDWGTDPVHAFWASDPLWTPNGTGKTDAAAVVQMRNGGTGYTQGAYLSGSGLVLTGSTADRANSPDSAALSITGDIDVRCYCALMDWTAAAGADYALGKGDGVSYDYTLYVTNTTGRLVFRWYDGSARTCTSSAAPTVSDGQAIWIRATLDVDNGAGGHSVRFYQSADGSTWSEIGTAQNAGAFTTSISDRATQLGIGTIGNGQGSGWRGTIYRAVIKNGIDGTTVFDADFSTVPAGRSAFLESSSNAAVVTIRSSVNVSQDTGSAQPTYRASTAAFGNKPTVQFDGTDDWLSANIADISAPYYVVMVSSQALAAGLIMGVGSGSAAYGMGVRVSPYPFELRAPTQLTGGTNDGAAHLWRGVFNGASSLLDIDEGANEVSGDIGATQALTWLSFGAGNFGGATPSTFQNGHTAYAAVFTSDPTTDAQWPRFKSWVTSFYGITLGA